MKKNKIISLVLATVIMGGVATPISAFAQEIVTSDNLEDSSRENTDKEEVVYVNLNNNGLVDKVYAVNIFNSKNIVDYGDYSEVRNMNTNDVLNYSNGKIVTTNSSDKLYYEGVLENAEIPWNIDISYYLNGERIKINKLNMKYFDILESSTSMDKLFSNGYSHNEINEFIGLPRIEEEWADKHYITKNYQNAELALEGGEGDGKDE